MSHARAVDTAVGVTPLRRRPGQVLKRRRGSRLLAIWRRVGSFLVLSAALAGGTSWALTSTRFALATVDLDIAGSGRVDAAWAKAAVAPLLGRNVFRLSIEEVEEPLADHPWIAQVAIHKLLPDRLSVELIERQPAALVPAGEPPDESWWLTDAAGRFIAPSDTDPLATPDASDSAPAASEGVEELIRVRPSHTADPEASPRRFADEVPAALELARQLADAQPAWAENLEEIRVLGENDFAVATSSLPFELLVRSDDLAMKTAYLEELLPSLGARFSELEAVDLRLSRRIVLKQRRGS